METMSLASNLFGNDYDAWGLTAGGWWMHGPCVNVLLEKNAQCEFQQTIRNGRFVRFFVSSRPSSTRAYLPGHQASTRLKDMKKCVTVMP